MAAILFIRVKSQLDEKELGRRLIELRSRFYDVSGLVQKIYRKDKTTGDICEIYFFESEAALTTFSETELAQMIPTSYEATEIRREIYDVLYPLRPERDPFTQ